MKAIILAAGRGSRLKGMTADRPKCLVEFAGKPLLAWQIAALRAAGLEDVAIVRGYRGDTLEPFGSTFFDNPRWAETNMVMSLAAASPWLRSTPCIVSYSDIVYEAEAARRLAASEAPLTILYDRNWRALWTRRFADPLSDAETFRADASGRLVEIGRRAADLDEIEGQYMGLLRFTPEGWSWVETLLAGLVAAVRDKLDMTSLLGRLLDQGRSIATVPFEGCWGEVDTPDDLAVYEGMAGFAEALRIDR